MMEIDEGSRAINLREIKFGDDGVSFDPNPKSCVACHGSPARPVWDPYDFWPNAFGSISGGTADREETRAYKALKKMSSHSPVLQLLNLPGQPEVADERINSLTYILGQAHFYNWWKRKLASFPLKSNLNGYRYALLSTLNLCQFRSARVGFENEKSLVFDLFADLSLSEKDKLDLIYNTISNDRSKFKEFLELAYRRLFRNSEVDFSFFNSRLESESQPLAITYWILDLMGLDTSDITTSLFKNNYLISMPTHLSLDLLTVLYDARPDLFFDLKVNSQDLATGHFGWLKLDCEQLKSLAQKQQMERQTESHWLEPHKIRRSQPIVNRCAKCHVEGFDPMAPVIPFHDSQLMAQRLRTSDLKQRIIRRVHATGADQMPPGPPLTSSEKEALKAYLDTLGSGPEGEGL
jgi:hypothetical protein